MKKLLLLITVLSSGVVMAQVRHIKVSTGVSGANMTYSLYQKQVDNSYTKIKEGTENRGAWRFDSLPSGMYRVHVAINYGKYLPTWHPRKVIWDEASDIDLNVNDSFIW